MSHEYAWPAQRGRSVEKGRASAPGAPAAGTGEAAALALAGLPQAFDVFVFGALALAVAPQVFLSRLPPGADLAGAVAVWALAYAAAWPARACAAGLDRRFDPKLRFAVARLLLAATSLGVAGLPAATAWSPLLLVVARIGQGLAIGALAHQPPAAPETRLRSRALATVGGLAAAGLVIGVLALALPLPELLGWGWRCPFVMALALNLAAFAADLAVERERAARRRKGRARLRLVAVAGELVAPPR